MRVFVLCGPFESKPTANNGEELTVSCFYIYFGINIERWVV